ncbi:MAG: hypothetical protein JHC98_10395 [Thermoleophilaceae bacterium]|nr:hypothetical protein [Thermoleophilaceae bacterium]
MPYLDDSDGTEERLADHFLGRPGVARKKAFARDALTINGKIFAIFRLGELVVKLPVEFGSKLIDAGEASQFEPAPGRFMKEWFVVGPEVDEPRWIELAEASFDYVLELQD